MYIIIELDDGKIYRKALYLMVKTMVSCRFSLKPIQWYIHIYQLITGNIYLAYFHRFPGHMELETTIKRFRTKTKIKRTHWYLYILLYISIYVYISHIINPIAFVIDHLRTPQLPLQNTEDREQRLRGWGLDRAVRTTTGQAAFAPRRRRRERCGTVPSRAGWWRIFGGVIPGGECSGSISVSGWTVRFYRSYGGY